MNENLPAAETTQICGYFNGNKWPIQLVISKLSITLHLQPGEFILDRSGRKINDPFFEVYANQKQLQRETSDKPVPVIRVPQVTTTVTPRNDGHSVRSVTEFKEDAKGLKQPVLPPPMAVPEQAVNKPSVMAMSVEQARRAGFIKKPREVPEDYGVTDTDGAPPRVSDVPKIKYAIDSSMTKRAPDLPKELLQMPEEIASSRAPLLTELKKGEANNAALDSESGFMNTVVRTAPQNAPIVAGKPAPVVESKTPPPPPPPAPSNVIQEANEVLPEPELDEEQTLPPVIETAEDHPVTQSPPAAAAKKEETVFQCSVCQVTRKFRKQLLLHAENKHPDQIAEIMAPYPE